MRKPFHICYSSAILTGDITYGSSYTAVTRQVYGLLIDGVWELVLKIFGLFLTDLRLKYCYANIS